MFTQLLELLQQLVPAMNELILAFAAQQQADAFVVRYGVTALCWSLATVPILVFLALASDG